MSDYLLYLLSSKKGDRVSNFQRGKPKEVEHQIQQNQADYGPCEHFLRFVWLSSIVCSLMFLFNPFYIISYSMYKRLTLKISNSLSSLCSSFLWLYCTCLWRTSHFVVLPWVVLQAHSSRLLGQKVVFA